MEEYDEQELRIANLLKGVNKKNIFKVLKVWEDHLNKELKFTFEAEICEYQERGVLKEGDILTVKAIDCSDDLYGVLVKTSIKRKQYIFPLCDLEIVDKKSENYLSVDDYRFWYSNR